MAKIRVFIADDHAVLRAGLRLLIHTQPDMEVVGEAGDFAEALRLVRSSDPDVLILDLTMPGGSGIQMVERLGQHCPRTRILVLTMHDDSAYLRAALAAGAAGYIVKKAADAELLSAIRAVFQGRVFVDTEVAGGKAPAVFAGHAGVQSARATGAASLLSQREREVLGLLAQGHTNQAIADRLYLSVKTVESYRSRLMNKLGFRTRADLIRYAVEIGLLGPGKFNAPDEGTA
jgi:DNA-binding NarL/FixJ family response regulator